MHLWLLSQTQHNDYDTYDSAVVAAETEDMARNIRPGGGDWDNGPWSPWCASPNDVNVLLIGDAIGVERGIVLASFNAG